MLEILGMLPVNNDSSVPIDQKISINFNTEIDPFTVSSGIALYTDSEGLWTGPEAGILDTKYKDVLDIANDYTYFQCNHTIEGNLLTLIPQATLLPSRKFYIVVYPGNDPTRYVSKKTTSIPSYTRVGVSNGQLEIASFYSGLTNDTYLFSFTSSDTADVSLQSGTYVGEFVFPENESVNLGLLSITRIGDLEAGDSIELDVYAPEGLTALSQTSFTTSAYSTFVPTSKRLDNMQAVASLIESELKLISSIPINNSVGNEKCNPITLKFNKTISDQELTDKIKIIRTEIKTGRKKQIKFYYKIIGDTVKLYLLNPIT